MEKKRGVLENGTGSGKSGGAGFHPGRGERSAGRKERLVALCGGSALSVLLWTGGLLTLAGAVALGAVKEGGCFPVLAVLTTLSTFAGAMYVTRYSPWGPLPSALAEAGGVAFLLAATGMALGGRIAWSGHSGILTVCCMAGGALAGMVRGSWNGRKRRKRHSW